MAFTRKERAEYNQHRERTSKELGIDKNAYNRLRRVGQALHKADENYANGTTGGAPKYSGNKITNRYEDKEHRGDTNKAFAKTKALKGKVNLYHQSDPRGASLYAGKKRLSQNDYNFKGHVIY